MNCFLGLVYILLLTLVSSSSKDVLETFATSPTLPLLCTKLDTDIEGWYRQDGSLVLLAKCEGETFSVCLHVKTEKEGWYTKNNVLISKARCSSGVELLPVGSVCSANEDCDSSYCSRSSGSCSTEGNCTVMPTSCTKILLPVCGCDGLNYSNPCNAASQGVSVDYFGYCRNADACLTNTDCSNATNYCSKDEGNCAAQGICVVAPQACTRQYEPVCGCDGLTYSNPCVAWSNHTAVDYHGKCTSVDSCTDTAECSSVNQFCMKQIGNCDSSVTPTGECTDLPHICTMIYNPVCGCDGNTYSSDCVAYSRGQNIKARGECAL